MSGTVRKDTFGNGAAWKLGGWLALVVCLSNRGVAQEKSEAEPAPPAAEAPQPKPPAAKDAPPGVPPLKDDLDAPSSGGSDDLAKAIEQKLAAENVGDLGEVIGLLRSALAKGLGDEDVAFAKKMLAGVLLQRASVVSQPVFDSNRNDPQWLGQVVQVRQIALADLQASLTYDSQAPEAHYLLARLHAVAGGDLAKAATALNDALRLEPEDQDLVARILALRAAVAGDSESRLADLNKALELSPKNADILRTRGLMYVQLGRMELALADLDQVVEMNSEQAGAYEARGMALIAAKEFDRAIGDLNRAIELAPESPVPRLQRARVKLLKQDAAGAIADLDAIADKLPNYTQAVLFRSVAHAMAGHADEAAADLKKAKGERERSGDSLRRRAAVWAGLEKFDEAIADLQLALESTPRDGQLILQVAELQLRQKQVTRAIESFTKALNIDETNWVVRQARADAMLSVGRQAEAIADYEIVLKADADNSGLLNNFAWVLATSPEDALRDGKRAVELASKACELTMHQRPHILSTLAASYAESGDFEKAKEWSQKAVDMAADEMRANLQKELDSYQAGKPWRELQDLEQAGLTMPVAPPPASAESAADAAKTSADGG